MKLVFWPSLVALIAQFGTLPLLIGGRTPDEIIGWPMIMAILFGIPSLVFYLILFTALQLVSLPSFIVLGLGVVLPASIVSCVFGLRGMSLDLSPKNWVMWMGMIGGLAGTITYLNLR